MNISQKLEAYLSPVYTTEFDPYIYTTRQDFIKTKSKWGIFKRKFFRDLSLKLFNQFRLLRQYISKNDKKILWLINDRPIGDFLMETGGRALFRGRGHEVHLFADEHFRHLFDHDDVVTKFISDPKQLNDEDYDLILVHSFTQRIFKYKLQYFRNTPFVTTNGYFIGPYYNENLLSYHALAKLLSIPITAEQAQAEAKPYIRVDETRLQPFASISQLSNPVAIAIGGKWDWKIYQHWQDVVRILGQSDLVINLLMIGSENGQELSQALINHSHNQNIKVLDYIGKLSLLETARVMKLCKVVACADGGLLHLANAVHTPTISLFSQYVDPPRKLTDANRSIAFHTPNNVSEVPPTLLAEAIVSALQHPMTGITINRLCL